MLRKTILTATALGALALPAAAAADVTLQPDAAPAGAFTRLDVRVPTERGVGTKRVVLELPPGFAFASYQPVAGWRIKMSQRELVQPLQIDGTDFDPSRTDHVDGADEGGRDPAGRLPGLRPRGAHPGRRARSEADVQRAPGVRGRRDGALDRRPHEPDACAAGDARRRPRPRGGRRPRRPPRLPRRRRPRRRASRRRGSSSPRSPRAASACSWASPAGSSRAAASTGATEIRAMDGGCQAVIGDHRDRTYCRGSSARRSGGQVAAVDAQDLAGHEPRGVRAQEEHRARRGPRGRPSAPAGCGRGSRRPRLPARAAPR